MNLSDAEMRPAAPVRWTLGATVWIICLSGMALFQAWRGAEGDALIFGLLVAVLAIDRARGERLRGVGKRWRDAAWLSTLLLVVAGVILVFVPRHGLVALLVMCLLGGVILLASWPSTFSGGTQLTPMMRRSAWTWGALAGAFVIWEGLAFAFSVTTAGGSAEHPTISVLLDPWLATLSGKALFIGLWILAGVGLLAVWRKPR